MIACSSGPSDHELALLSLHGRIGRWWEKGAPDSTFAGSLEIEGDQIALCLSLQDPSPAHPFGLESGPIAAIHGSVDGKAISLAHCLVTNENSHEWEDAGYSARITIRPDLVLVGQRHADPAGAYSLLGLTTNEVQKIFRVHPLKRIDPKREVRSAAFTADADMSTDEFMRSSFALVERPNLNCFNSDIASIKGSISYQFSAYHSFDRVRGATASYTPRLVIELQEPAGLYRLLRHARQATHLLSLISLSPNHAFDIDVSQNADHLGSWKLFQNGKQRSPPSSNLQDWQVLTRYPKHQELFPRLWSRWFETRKDHAVPRWIFQSTLEQSQRFDINRFLNVMQCLEIMTKLYADGTLMDKAEFDRFCAVVEAEAARHVHSDSMALATRMLRQQNRPPLLTRLQSLLSRLDGRVLRWLLGDELQALSLAVKARNYFTHFGDLSASKREMIEQNLGLLTCKMSALYVVLELDMLGVPPSAYLTQERFALPWMMRWAVERDMPSA